MCVTCVTGEGQGLNVCAFCGKPTSKSSLSRHLLVCKKRKESQQRRFGLQTIAVTAHR